MKNLYSRLKPEVVLALQNEAVLYPNIVAKTVNELEKKYFMYYLTLETVLYLGGIEAIRTVAGVKNYTEFHFTSVLGMLDNLLIETNPLSK
jgi:hypothetical protein